MVDFFFFLGGASAEGHQARGGDARHRRGTGQGERETAQGGEWAGRDGKKTPAGKHVLCYWK